MVFPWFSPKSLHGMRSHDKKNFQSSHSAEFRHSPQECAQLDLRAKQLIFLVRPWAFWSSLSLWAWSFVLLFSFFSSWSSWSCSWLFQHYHHGYCLHYDCSCSSSAYWSRFGWVLQNQNKVTRARVLELTTISFQIYTISGIQNIITCISF